MAPAVRTIPHLFFASVERFGDHIMLREKRNGAWQARSYREAAERVTALAAGLLARGLEKGERVALLAEGAGDWLIGELAVLVAGGISVPLSIKLEETEELRFRLAHSGCRRALVSTRQADKLLRARPPETLMQIIALDGELNQAPVSLSLATLLEEGRAWRRDHAEELDRRWRSVAETDVATICYTSGTTADPKGVMLTHRNYVVNAAQSGTILPIPETYVTLLILPWDHAFAHTCGLYTMIRSGATIAAVEAGRTPQETLRNIPESIRAVRPHFLLSVPALAHNFRRGIEKSARQKGALAATLVGLALKLADRRIDERGARDRGWRRLLAPPGGLLDRVCLRPVREGFGGRLEFFIGGGALLDRELQRFFHALGMPMLQGYGLTEAGPVISANVPAAHRLGSSGRIVPGLEVRILASDGRALPAGEAGEITVRGENVMAGYWNNPRATAEALRDGWLFTGDLGYLDADGFLFVLGRAKSLLISDDGEKFSPEGIEEMLVSVSPFISQIMLHNNQSPCTMALVVPDREALRRAIEREGGDDPAGRGCRLLAEEIAAFRAGGAHGGRFPDKWLPAAFAILDEPFSESNHCLNSTMKMVRSRITERYQARLEEMNAAAGRKADRASNREAISRCQT